MKMGQISATRIDDGFARDDTFVALFYIRLEAGGKNGVCDVDEKTLQTVAGTTGGTFYRATDTDSLEKIYGEINRLENEADNEYRRALVAELVWRALDEAAGS